MRASEFMKYPLSKRQQMLSEATDKLISAGYDPDWYNYHGHDKLGHAEAVVERAELKAEIERLRAELDDEQMHHREAQERLVIEIKRLRSQITALENTLALTTDKRQKCIRAEEPCPVDVQIQEIARLRAENERLQDRIDLLDTEAGWGLGDQDVSEIERLRAACEKARAVLRQKVGHEDMPLDQLIRYTELSEKDGIPWPMCRAIIAIEQALAATR